MCETRQTELMLKAIEAQRENIERAFAANNFYSAAHLSNDMAEMAKKFAIMCENAGRRKKEIEDQCRNWSGFNR